MELCAQELLDAPGSVRDGRLTPTMHGVYNPNRSYFGERSEKGKFTFCVENRVEMVSAFGMLAN